MDVRSAYNGIIKYINIQGEEMIYKVNEND